MTQQDLHLSAGVEAWMAREPICRGEMCHPNHAASPIASDDWLVRIVEQDLLAIRAESSG